MTIIILVCVLEVCTLSSNDSIYSDVDSKKRVTSILDSGTRKRAKKKKGKRRRWEKQQYSSECHCLNILYFRRWCLICVTWWRKYFIYISISYWFDENDSFFLCLSEQELSFQWVDSSSCKHSSMLSAEWIFLLLSSTSMFADYLNGRCKRI
jgi:hypothetical protein